MHKMAKYPKINFGIFKPVTSISIGVKKKKKKPLNLTKTPEKKKPLQEQRSDIFKENYSYKEETLFSFKNKDSLLFTKPKNLYDRLVLEKLKPNKIEDVDSSSSSYNSEEKKINGTTINKIKIFSDHNDTDTLLSKYPFLYNTKIKKQNQDQGNINSDQKNINNNITGKKEVQFMPVKDNKEGAEKYVKELINKNNYFFEKNFINKHVFNNINKDIFMKRLIEEMNEKNEEIPFYLYEDDTYLLDIFEQTAFKLMVENLEKNQYLYEKNENVLPQVIEYHKYLKDFANMYNSIGGNISLDELYEEDIYIKNRNIQDELEKEKENKMIKNIIKNKKVSVLSEKFKNYMQKNQKKLSIKKTSKEKEKNKSKNKKNKSKYSEIGSTSISNTQDYSNIIPKVIENNNNTKLESAKKKRTKILSLEKTELKSIEKMIGRHIRTSENKESLLDNEQDINTFEFNKKNKLKYKNIPPLLKDYKYNYYDNDNSYLDCPDLYERPKGNKIIKEELRILNEEQKIKNKKKNKRTKSMYNKFFKNKFKY